MDALPSVNRASNILNEYGAAQSELIGKTVVLTDGKAGTVENVWLDESHGLRISISVAKPRSLWANSSGCEMFRFQTREVSVAYSAGLTGFPVP